MSAMSTRYAPSATPEQLAPLHVLAGAVDRARLALDQARAARDIEVRVLYRRGVEPRDLSLAARLSVNGIYKIVKHVIRQGK